MIRSTTGFVIFLLCLQSASDVHAESVLKNAYNFSDIYSEVTERRAVKDLSDTLIVMDDDDTLTMMACPNPTSPAECQYLGGPSWIDWQIELVNQFNSEGHSELLPGQVAASDDAVFAIGDLLFDLNQMVLADSSSPTALINFASLGASLMVLTSRDAGGVSATQAQLRGLDMPSGEIADNMLDLIDGHAPTWRASGESSMAGTETKAFCNASMPVAYRNGILYTTGQNKGEMLKCFLRHSEVENISKIIFVDDTEKNVIDVHNAFSVANTPYDMAAFHFTHLTDHKERFSAPSENGPMNKYQTMATSRWKALRHILGKTLLKPAKLE
ncbi:DUF2608 domain-containing protein [uncultured Ruegeria sp.]|uniref:DUF2608 domain-containing protein n=1 Tax=uncultured Ruegeria sp. TaxID=259304 RepID=UPI00261C1274|nr:DUF2608 domain-containing protein [uncultured Ruegeria sp.]